MRPVAVAAGLELVSAACATSSADATVTVLAASALTDAVGEPPAKDATGDPLFNRLWTFLHVPCINVPGFSGPAGLPVGVQLIAARHNDRGLLAAAKWAAARIERP